MEKKYKVEDLVRIKSMSWWEEQDKDDDGDIIPFIKGFNKELALECCGKIGKVIDIDPIENTYEILFSHSTSGSSFQDAEIENKIEYYSVSLRKMKNEI